MRPRENAPLLVINPVKRAKLQGAARHISREIQAELGCDSHIDARKIHLNYFMFGADNSIELMASIKKMITDAGVMTPRKNGIFVLELIASLPPDTRLDKSSYFAGCLSWAKKYYQLPVVSAVVHLDESAPHVHIWLLAFKNGKMCGSEIVGGLKQIYAAHESFYLSVGASHGLVRPKRQKAISWTIRKQAAQILFDELKSNHDILNEPGIKSALLELLEKDPERLMLEMGLDMPKIRSTTTKTLADIFCKPQPPEKHKKPNREFIVKSKNHNSLCSVRELQSNSNNLTPPTPKPSPADEPETSYQRIRDDDQHADTWDGDTGEFIHRQANSYQRATML